MSGTRPATPPRSHGWAPFVLDNAVMPHPTDGSVWYTLNVFAGTPGFLRFDPKTKLSEFYAIPKEGIGVRGGDIESRPSSRRSVKVCEPTLGDFGRPARK
jgi:hypothetical protein